MAAALLEHHAMGRIDVRSAGSAPSTDIHPGVISALAEWGIDIASQHPKLLDPKVVKASDLVITMGCGDACPIYPGTRYLDWDLTNPAGQDISVVRRVRDEIDRRVRSLLTELLDDLQRSDAPGSSSVYERNASHS